MLKKFLIPVIFAVLGYGFWASPDFKEIAAGVAIFLIGMLMLEDGFKAFTGGILERILKQATDKLWKSLSFGILTTTLMQSSSLVSVITISFLTAGLITLTQGIGIIFGSNLGTTTGAWIIAGFGFKVDIAAYAMPMVVFGVILMFQKNKSWKGIGYILTGLGLLFLGIAYMKSGFEALGQDINLEDYSMSGLRGLLVYTAIGMAATVIMQSSHATLVLTIAALAAGQVTYENGLALAIGSNVGTTITAILGALSANVAGRRLAGAHLIFNTVTGAIAIVFIHQLVIAVDTVSDLLGIGHDDYTLKLAVFHTIFNLIGILVMIPTIKLLVAFLEKILVQKEEVAGVAQPLFVKDIVLETPDTALEATVKEAMHLARNVVRIMAHALNLHRTDVVSDEELEKVVERSTEHIDINVLDLYQKRVKPIYGAILSFSSKAAANMEPEQAEELYHLQVASRELVGAVKILQELQPNVARYMVSDNEFARQEYNQIRMNVAKLLRRLYSIVDNRVQDIDEIRAMLAEEKLEVEQNDILANGRLDKLIRENLIDQQVASSLMNDSAFTYDLFENVIDAAEIIFAKFISLEKDMTLVETEIDQALLQTEAELDLVRKREAEEIDKMAAGSNPANS
jgi:phosphate:Na+ symporter